MLLCASRTEERENSMSDEMSLQSRKLYVLKLELILINGFTIREVSRDRAGHALPGSVEAVAAVCDAWATR